MSIGNSRTRIRVRLFWRLAKVLGSLTENNIRRPQLRIKYFTMYERHFMLYKSVRIC